MKIKTVIVVLLLVMLCALLYVSNRSEGILEGTSGGSGNVAGNSDGATAGELKDNLLESVFVRFSSTADGSGMTETWLSGQRYVGVSVAAKAPISPSSYTWVEMGEAGTLSLESINILIEKIHLDASEFQIGSWSVHDGDKPNLNNKKRVCTVSKHRYPFEVYVKVSREYQAFACLMYDDGTLGEIPLSQELIIPANTTFVLTVQDYWGIYEVDDVGKYAEQISLTGNPYALIVEKIAESTNSEECTPLKVKGINHSGWWEAPENTLSAYKQSAKKGFDFVECDIRFTADNVPVLLHDATINRTARNSDGTDISTPINITDITLETAKSYDFGIWKGAQYAATSIPTLEEFLILCRNLGLYPYLDVKDLSITEEQANALNKVLTETGYRENATILLYSASVFDKLQALLPAARYGYVVSSEPNDNAKRYLLDMHKRANAFLNCKEALVNDWLPYCKEWGIALEAWTVDSEAKIIALDPYVTGVTSNKWNAQALLKEYYIQ